MSMMTTTATTTAMSMSSSQSMMRNRALHGVPGGAIAGPALWAAAKARVMKWDHVARSPRSVQERTLLANCHAAADSMFGRDHDLASVRTYADFCARVPLRTYDELIPYIERLRFGERDVLLPGLVPYLARTAGSSRTTTTTSAAEDRSSLRYLPISHAQIAWQKKQAFDIVARYLVMSGDKRFPSGFTIGLLQPPTIEWEHTPAGDVIGLTSNPRLMQLHVPKIAHHVSLPRSPVREIEDYDEKFRAIAEAYLGYDVRAIAGTTCWFTALFDRVIAAARARGRDVSTVNEIWPNLRGLFGGGVHAGSYRSIIDARVGAPTTLVDTYNATEGGCFAVTDRQGSDEMVVIPDRGVFFEFVPRAEHGRPNAKRVQLADVEVGVEYSVALSTASGLFGYLIGDVVRFTSVFPHRLVFSGRVNGEISVAHEATSAREIEAAVRRAASLHDGCTIVELTAAADVPSPSGAGRYLIFIEFDRAPPDLQQFEHDVDAALCAENRLYRKHRTRDIGILPLRVVPLVRGGSQRFAEAAHRRGLQQKFPRVVQAKERDLLLSSFCG